MLLWNFRSEDGKLKLVQRDSSGKWPAIIEIALRDRSRKVRWQAASQSLMRGTASLQEQAVAVLAAMGDVPLDLLRALPQLVEMVGSRDGSARANATRVVALLQCEIPRGRDACPRCGSTRATEGNATGWTCNVCGLRYRAHAERNPLAFIATGGFRGGPWNTSETHELVTMVLQGPVGKGNESTWAGYRRRAEDLVSQWRESLRRCGV